MKIQIKQYTSHDQLSTHDCIDNYNIQKYLFDPFLYCLHLLHRQQCGPYNGSACNQVFGSSAQVSISRIGSLVVEAAIDVYVINARQNIGNDFTPQCENVARYVQCIQLYPLCMDRVWCSDLSENDIQQRIDASCQCSGNEPFCGQLVSSLRGLAGNLTNYHVTDQAPSGSTCQTVTLGEASNRIFKLLFHSFPQVFYTT